jgi:2-polyprenyl-3-methyl-5-hydroxy-6-metoxy-1,4-benzoquinol methylase
MAAPSHTTHLLNQHHYRQDGYNQYMQGATLQQLLDINYQFYQSFGTEFSATRARIQPGVGMIINRLEGHEHILDLGCGNGELARQLAKRGHKGSYTGLDFSLPLLAAADQQPGTFPVNFFQADLTRTDWEKNLPTDKYHMVLSFAALHHIPSEQLRLQIFIRIASLLKKEGKFIHSHWQFLNSPRLRDRIQPWQKAGIRPQDVEPGDYLLDWKRGGTGFRYVYHFDEDELSRLAAATGFYICDSFHSDGQGGRLGLYQIWEKQSTG